MIFIAGLSGEAIFEFFPGTDERFPAQLLDALHRIMVLSGLPGQTAKFAECVQPVANSIELRLRRKQCEREVIERGIRDDALARDRADEVWSGRLSDPNQPL